MGDGDVKIHVSADGDTRAIDDAKRKVEQLGKTQTASEANPRPPQRQFRKLTEEERAANRERIAREDAAAKANKDPLAKQRAAIAKGLVDEGAARAAGNTAAADAIRSEVDIMEEALGLQKKHGISQKDAFTIARNNRKEEEATAQALKEQAAMRKAGIGTRGMAQAVGVGEQILSGGNPASTASSLLVRAAMMSANPVAIAAATTAALATSFAGGAANQAEWEKMQLLGKNTRVANTAFNLNRQSGVFGSSASLVNTSLDAEAEIASRRNSRPELVEKARIKWEAPSTWKGLLGFKTDGQKELEESDAKSAEAQARMVEAQNRAKERYIQTEGRLELDVLRQRSQRTLAGSRQAFADEEAAKGFAKYQEVIKNGGKGASKMAEEMATLTIQNDIRDRQAAAGAGLVDARSGGAEIAAAARWGMQATPQAQESVELMKTLIGVVNRGNQDATVKEHSK